MAAGPAVRGAIASKESRIHGSRSGDAGAWRRREYRDLQRGEHGDAAATALRRARSARAPVGKQSREGPPAIRRVAPELPRLAQPVEELSIDGGDDQWRLHVDVNRRCRGRARTERDRNVPADAARDAD